MGVVASLAVLLLMIWANAQAARHYCQNGAVMKIDVSRELDQCESLFPITADSAASSGDMKCRWEISAPRTDTVVVILSGFNISEETPKRWKRSTESQVEVNSQRIHYQLHISASSAPSCSKNPESIKSVDSEETFRVILLTKESLLVVTFDQASITKVQAAPGLRVQVVEKEFCTRETLNFQSRCYRVSTVPRSLTDELANFINGDSGILQLASFDSTDAIQSFVEANKQKTVGSGDEVRSREPLNLNQAVRIGLFMDKQKHSITYLTVSEGQCQMKDFQASANENFTDLSTDPSHACGSLRVDQMSGRGILEFRNCSESLAALISFADTPRDCSNCSETIQNWIRDLESEASSHSRIVSFSGNVAVIGSASVCASIVLAVGIVVAIVRKCGRKAGCRESGSSRDSGSFGAALLHPQLDRVDNQTA